MDQQSTPETIHTKAQEEIYEAQLVNQVVHTKEQGIKKINEYWVKGDLGQGAFGKVKLVTRDFWDDDVLQQCDYAMKIFHRVLLENQRTCYYELNSREPKMTTMLEFALSEINIWKYLNHPNICKLYQIIDDDEDPKDQIYLIMQLGDFGCIMNFNENTQQYDHNQNMLKHYEMPLELLAKHIFKQVALGIQYLHNNNIVNRDIKLDNIIASKDCIQIIDFTTARYAQPQSIFYDCAGTAGFRAPELQFCLDEGYDPFKLDIWSFGVCLYIFLHNKLPFWGECELEIDIQAKNNEIVYSAGSKEYQDLIAQCCQKRADLRPTIAQVLSHPYFV